MLTRTKPPKIIYIGGGKKRQRFRDSNPSMSATTAAITIFAMPSPRRGWARMSNFPDPKSLRELALKICRPWRDQCLWSNLSLEILRNIKARQIY